MGKTARGRRERSLLRGVAVVTAVGGFVMDWNRTHLFNPAWPPHARFHDAFTISLGAMLGLLALFFLRRGSDRRDLAIGAALPAIFWASQGASFTFPGAEGLESEFPQYVPRVRGIWINERFASGLMLALTLVGYARAQAGTRRRAGSVLRRS
jgi:hypothetical protein